MRTYREEMMNFDEDETFTPPPHCNLIAMLVVAAVTLAAVAPADADLVVLPNGFAAVEGSLGQNTVIQDDPRTHQSVYAASQLSGVPLGSSITGLTYRQDGGGTTWPPSNRNWTDYDIQLSTSLNPPGSLNNTFADNIGADVVTVRSGALTIPTNSFPGGATPNAFGFEILFTTPYVYNGGDLLITTRHTGNGIDTEFVDSNTFASQPYRTIAANSFTATTQNLNVTSTPIVRLTFTPIPEPSTIVLVGVGVAALLAACWRRKRA